MTAVLKQSWLPFLDSWALALQHFPLISNGSFVTSSSSGALALCALDGPTQPLQINKTAHEACVNAIDKIDQYTLASASADGIKVWDLRQSLNRPQLSLTNSRKLTFLSLGSNAGHWLAGGTELVGTDAELHLWDLKSPAHAVRLFVDSHHDDITAVTFHGSLPYLMSGSTDGYVNVYNLGEPDEDEALHQVINFASVHLCHFVQPNRISVLSHMETLAFWELNNTNYEAAEEPRPRVLGDVRAVWPDCEYVVDIHDAGYVSYGANLKLSLTLVPFDAKSEGFDASGSISLLPAHGEDVVRDVMFIPGTRGVLTCGEDGLVKAWELPSEVPSGLHAVGDALADNGVSTQSSDKDRKRQERKERKKKKDRKDKNKPKKDARFKPY
ncbi:WD40 repeat-like protein [Metschnikowia bicuspidata var. bicuspidata NRRL YB-4993]|uniref:WD40 repeat-like protein n=1 Tax=Metschnikowia bicuspidata var. bicuspidata NRRL YB-4993 TaxID=869754 RepID=A0A1A0HIT8_9ASCO|nr:WD40 repeat-like protein [Metschnikowia bicuspidata var. bicuspidata NRRL YB-4993]OBA23753.1 WD40 repeat-like protein [Metschnikowia bicuspidata var. bicuspidata NRRL YB-4993]